VPKGLVGVLLLLGACAPSTQGRREADDRDVERDILWELRKDRRFADVRVASYGGVVTLEGVVPDRGAQDEALLVVNRVSIGARIINKLIVRPR
jgi:osmotically-inducible protein OsmY